MVCGMLGKGRFDTGIEPAIGVQFALGGLESRLQAPFTGRLHVLHDKLEIAPGGIQTQLAAHDHRIPAFGVKIHVTVTPLEHGAANLRLTIF